jgi:hypothetical protein
MAGPFAHMCVVDQITSQPDLFSALGGPGAILRYAVAKYRNFCELGAVSPDLPYLDFLHASSKGWANVMHYWKTGDVIRAGVSHFAGQDLAAQNHDVYRALAWLFGYSAHVATDLTVHPVLKASGFGFDTNPTGHRHCELHQDAYIFRKLHGVEAADTLYIENCGIASCQEPGNPARLHPAVRGVWLDCLAGISPTDVHMENGADPPVSAPTPDAWFHEYVQRLGVFVEQGGGFALFIRDILEDQAVCLPESGEVDPQYVTHLKTARGLDTDYDAVFGEALRHVRDTWEQLAAAIAAQQPQVFALKNANLDTGEADDNRSQVFPA